MKSRIYASIILIVCTMLLAGCSKNDGNGANRPEISPEHTIKSGDSIELDELKVTFQSYREDSKGQGIIKPDDGYMFLTLTLKMENSNVHSLNVNINENFTAFCDGGQVYADVDAMVLATDAEPMQGLVATGRYQTGVIGYQVPEDYSEFVLYFSWGEENTIALLIEK